MRSIENVSFVIITYNEFFGVRKCLDSICRMDLKKCEILCVDSGSSDGTLDCILSYKDRLPSLELYKVLGFSTAAVGRNIGLELAEKEYVFFVDGDIEVNQSFIHSALQLMQDQKADAVTGGLEEYQYDAQFTQLSRIISDRFEILEQNSVRICGGCFIARRRILNKVGFYIDNMMKNEDIDYSLRLTEKNLLLAIPVSMGIHHTVSYDNATRLKQEFFTEHRYYGKVLLNNIFRPKNMYALLRRYTGITFGLMFYALVVVIAFKGVDSGIFILLAIVMADMSYGCLKKQAFAYRLYLHYICPLITLVGGIIPIKRQTRHQSEVLQLL